MLMFMFCYYHSLISTWIFLKMSGCFCSGIRTFVVQNLQNYLHQLKSNCHFRISDCDKASRKRKYSSASAVFPLINIFFKLYKLKIAKPRHKSVLPDGL